MKLNEKQLKEFKDFASAVNFGGLGYAAIFNAPKNRALRKYLMITEVKEAEKRYSKLVGKVTDDSEE